MDIFQVLGNNRFPKKDHLKGMQVRVHKKLELLASHEIMEVLGSHLDALDALNTLDIGQYALASGLAPDEYHFLNLRAGIIMQGRKCFERVLAGDYESLEKLRGFTWQDWRLDENIRLLLELAYHDKTNRSSLFDEAPFYSEVRFIRQLQNPVYAPKNSAPVRVNVEIDSAYAEDMYRMMRHKLVECAHFPHLGIVRQGSVLRHETMGICWVYEVMFRPSNQDVEAMMLFKNGRLHYMVMRCNLHNHNGQLWSPCPESDWQG